MTVPAAVSTAIEVVNLVDKVTPLVNANVVVLMPQYAAALPPGVDPNVAGAWHGWSSDPQSLQLAVEYTPNLPGFSSCKFHLGVRFNHGGTTGGQPWTYIKDLEAFVIVDSTMLAHELDVDVKFASTGTPIETDKTVMLTGGFNCRFSHRVWGLEFSEFYAIKVFGNGGARIAQQ